MIHWNGEAAAGEEGEGKGERGGGVDTGHGVRLKKEELRGT
jgi:hypothetical protein